MRAAEFTATVVPTLRYRDVAAAIDWLCEAFGFDHLGSKDHGMAALGTEREIRAAAATGSGMRGVS